MPHVPPPVIALGAAGVQHLLAPERRSGAVRRVLAVALGAGSVWFLAGSARQFLASGTTVDPLDPAKASTLVTNGPNAVTRNPMYVGMAGLLATHAVARGGWATLLPVAGFVGVIDRFQVQPEEAALRTGFGAAYEDYCRQVRRWF